MKAWRKIRLSLIAIFAFCSATPSETLLEFASGRSWDTNGNPGQASHTPGNWAGGNCMFKTYPPPKGIYGAAISDKNWFNAGNCGACLEVTAESGRRITAMVVDKCTGCPENYLSIFDDGYRQLLPRNQFVDQLNIDWHVVSCAFNSPIAIQNKPETSKTWYSLQVQNANWPVDEVHVSTNGGATWYNMVSKDWNYFEKKDGTGFGTDRIDLKIVCFGGSVVYVRSVSVQGGQRTWADRNC